MCTPEANSPQMATKINIGQNVVIKDNHGGANTTDAFSLVRFNLLYLGFLQSKQHSII